MARIAVQDRPALHWPVVIALFGLLYLVVVVFFPIPGFEFVDYDVDEQVLRNPYIRGLTGENLKHIFTSRCISSYYPIRTLSYAVDYSVWGLDPRGFKLTNGLIHWVNVVMVFSLILRVYPQVPMREGGSPAWDVFAAAFATAIFAIHPVVVEPVTWVPGREELLMTLGALGCFHFHLSARGVAEDAGRAAVFGWHAAAAISCALACLSNAVAAVIPLLITAWDLLTLAKPRRRKVIAGTAALWVIGATALVIKVLCRNAESIVLESGISVPERLRLVLSVYWLNVKSLVWPSELAVYYSRVKPGTFLTPTVVLGAMAAAATCLAMWKLRRQKVLLFGLLWFVLALGPSSQILVHHIHRADRFLYLPLVGLVVSLSIAFRALDAALRSRTALVGATAMAVLVVLVLDMRSIRQVQTWQDSLALWENCVEICPDNAIAHDLLAKHLLTIGDVPRAEKHALRSLELDFADNHAALCSRVRKLIGSDRFGQPGHEEAVRLARRACDLTQWSDPQCLHILAKAYLASDQRDLAVATGEKAAELAERAGAPKPADEIRRWLRDIQARSEVPAGAMRERTP